MNVQEAARRLVILTMAVFLIGATVAHAATPQKMNGTWASLNVIAPNDILGNTDPLVVPSLDTFSTKGTVVTSSGASVLALETDQGSFLAALNNAQGSWKFRAGRFTGTQWRFVNDTATGQPIGYIKTTAEWTLANENIGSGVFRVELLQLDMMTPYTSDGSPAAASGSFEMWRLPVQGLD